jgi:hypothetical protein
MKKVLLALVIIFAGFLSTQAQVNPHAIGLRLGAGTYSGGEISYQHGMGDNHRVELDLGWGGHSSYNVLTLAAIFHWNWNITGGLNWYIGPGAMVGAWSYWNTSSIGIGIGGQVGIEYDFNTLNIPVLLSLDVRPMWNFQNDFGGFGYGTALGIRYTF